MAETNGMQVPNFRIFLNGNEMEAEKQVTLESLRVEEELNSASMFALRFSAFDSGKGAIRYLDLETFALGDEVGISLGMDTVMPMLVGEITALEPKFGPKGTILEVRGYDRLHRLRFGTKQRTFLNVKDSDIASQIAGDWGLSAETDATSVTYPYVYQNNQNDLEFLLNRARKIRYETMVEDKKLKFRKPKEGEAAELTLEYLVDINELSFKLSPHYEASEFVVNGWDAMKKEPITATAKSGKEVSKMEAKETGAELSESAFGSATATVTGENVIDASHAEELAVARFNSRLVEAVTGGGTCPGNPKIRAGKNIAIKGVSRFSGLYYVTSTTHVLDKNGYTTSFKMRRTGV